jgi:hypothetical protein
MNIALIKNLSLVSLITLPLLCCSVPSSAQRAGCRFLLDNCDGEPGQEPPNSRTADELDSVFLNGQPFTQSTIMGIFRVVYRSDGIVTLDQVGGTGLKFQFNWRRIANGFCKQDGQGSAVLTWNCYTARKVNTNRWEVFLLDAAGRIIPGTNTVSWTRP